MTTPNISETISLLSLDRLLSETFGDNWYKLEEETKSLELGIVFSTLLLQKVRLLKVLLGDIDDDYGQPPKIESDPLFFVHSCDIINSQVVVPTVISMPNSLEAAYAIYVLRSLPIKFTPRKAVEMICEHALKQDGFYEPVPPFDFVPIANFSMAGRATKEDITNKVNAIKAYIHLMENGGDA